MPSDVELVTKYGEVVPMAQALDLRGRASRTSLLLPDNLSEGEWKVVGENLGKIESGYQWWIGDWWAFGEHRYRERKAIVTSDAWEGPQFQACMDAGSVSTSFKETSRRREVLSFNHHREVMGLPPDIADSVLDWAEETVAETGRPRSIRETRNRVREVDPERQLTERSWPKGRFSVIYADPPWQYDFSLTENREIENHYPTMPVADICALGTEILEKVTDDAVLFLWATSPKLIEAFQVIGAWGFTYVTHAIWAKDKIGMGYYFRSQHEPLLIAKRGNLPPPAESDRISSIVPGVRAEHSRKPEVFYQIIEQLYPDLPKLELFARKSRRGWQSWGNEAIGDAA